MTKTLHGRAQAASAFGAFKFPHLELVSGFVLRISDFFHSWGLREPLNPLNSILWDLGPIYFSWVACLWEASPQRILEESA